MKGAMTVEAVLLIPFLMLLSVVMVYFCVFTYDRALITMDTNEIVTETRGIESETVKIKKGEELFENIKKEHPYMSVKDMNVIFERRGLITEAKVSGKWKLPVWTAFNRVMEYEKDLYTVKPVTVMYSTEQVLSFMGAK